MISPTNIEEFPREQNLRSHHINSNPSKVLHTLIHNIILNIITNYHPHTKTNMTENSKNEPGGQFSGDYDFGFQIPLYIYIYMNILVRKRSITICDLNI